MSLLLLPFLVSCHKSPTHGGWCSQLWPSKAENQWDCGSCTLSLGLIDAFLFASFGNLALRAASPLKADYAQYEKEKSCHEWSTVHVL